MLDVVVLPWVPETAIVGLSRVSSPSRSARCSSGAPVVRSGLVGRDRARVDDLGAVGDVGGVVADRRLDPGRRSVPPYGEPAARSEPVTLAPSACATTASPLMPGAADAHEVQSSS